MHLTRNIHKLPLTRILALVALLCVGAMQVQEVGHSHWHEQGDGYSECLVCKSSSGAILPMEVPQSRALSRAPLVLVAAFDLPCLGSHSCFEARGPPSYS